MKKVETILLENLGQFTAFVRKRIDDPELAADVVQDSLLKAFKSADQLRENENIMAWFYRILRNTLVDVYRRRDANRRALETMAVDREFSFSAEDQGAACRCFEALLPSIRSEYAELLRRIDLAGEPPESVAFDLGIKPNNLHVRLHRARNQLRTRLEEICQMCSKHGCRNCTCDT